MGRIWSVQVKTAHATKTGLLRVHTEGHKYDSASFDVLVAVCPDGRVFRAPWTFATSRAKTLNVLKQMSPLL